MYVVVLADIEFLNLFFDLGNFESHLSVGFFLLLDIFFLVVFVPHELVKFILLVLKLELAGAHSVEAGALAEVVQVLFMGMKGRAG